MDDDGPDWVCWRGYEFVWVGYGLMSVIFIVVGISVGTAICWLVIETFFNPSATLLISDIILFVAMYLFFTSKFFKRNWKEFWGQFKNNL